MNQTASMPFRDAGRRENRANEIQRWGALIGGSAIAIYGLTRRSAIGVAMAAGGGTLAYFAASANKAQMPLARTSVLVNASKEDAFRFWHNFEEFPLFMHHIESVTAIGNRRYRWVAIGPMNRRVTWDAEITEDRSPDVIAWRSLPGSDIAVNGMVRFERATGDRGTVVTADIRYSSPGGPAGRMLAKLFGKDPRFLMEQDLRRAKALIETGEIPTVEGQTHGPRSIVTAAARVIDPDRPLKGPAPLTEVLQAKRRVS